MIAAGLDIGGTKIEAQIFDRNWQRAAERRIPTPAAYAEMIEAVGTLTDWIMAEAGGVPVGAGSAGLVNPATGLALTANLPATGHALPADITRRAGRPVSFLNDCRALTLSEAVFGAGRGASPVVGLILGTGVGGGVAIDGRLVEGPLGVGGEFGHTALPARVVDGADLPIVQCGCGRTGCIETLISGPGLTRLARARGLGDPLPEEIAARRETDADIGRVWSIWCDLVAELLLSITFTVDPRRIVIGGGLSRIAGVERDLAAALARAQLPGFSVPEIVLAEGGDASGARGAALFAWHEAGHD